MADPHTATAATAAATPGSVAAGGTRPSPSAFARLVRPSGQLPVLAAVSAGGVVGALARYGLGVAFPHHPPGGFPWATFAVNASGCALIGVLMVFVTDVWSARRLARPFLGTGVLGGYTTFSAAIVDAQHLFIAGAARTGLVYLAGTLVAALVAVAGGAALARMALARLRHARERRGGPVAAR